MSFRPPRLVVIRADGGSPEVARVPEDLSLSISSGGKDSLLSAQQQWAVNWQWLYVLKQSLSLWQHDNDDWAKIVLRSQAWGSKCAVPD